MQCNFVFFTTKQSVINSIFLSLIPIMTFGMMNNQKIKLGTLKQTFGFLFHSFYLFMFKKMWIWIIQIVLSKTSETHVTILFSLLFFFTVSFNLTLFPFSKLPTIKLFCTNSILTSYHWIRISFLIIIICYCCCCCCCCIYFLSSFSLCAKISRFWFKNSKICVHNCNSTLLWVKMFLSAYYVKNRGCI